MDNSPANAPTLSRTVALVICLFINAALMSVSQGFLRSHIPFYARAEPFCHNGLDYLVATVPEHLPWTVTPAYARSMVLYLSGMLAGMLMIPTVHLVVLLVFYIAGIEEEQQQQGANDTHVEPADEKEAAPQAEKETSPTPLAPTQGEAGEPEVVEPALVPLPEEDLDDAQDATEVPENWSDEVLEEPIVQEPAPDTAQVATPKQDLDVAQEDAPVPFPKLEIDDTEEATGIPQVESGAVQEEQLVQDPTEEAAKVALPEDSDDDQEAIEIPQAATDNAHEEQVAPEAAQENAGEDVSAGQPTKADKEKQREKERKRANMEKKKANKKK